MRSIRDGKPRAENRQSGGARRAILGDLSPAATLIAANYNLPFDVSAFREASVRLLQEVDAEIGWMYETFHTDGQTTGRNQLHRVERGPFLSGLRGRSGVSGRGSEQGTRRTRSSFPCPHCAATLTKNNLVRLFETLVDPASGQPWKRIRLRPVLIDYNVGDARYEKEPDAADLHVLESVAGLPLPSEVPTDAFPIDEMYHGSRLAPKGFTHVHHLFLSRAAHALAAMWRRANSCSDVRQRQILLFFVEQAIATMSVLNRLSSFTG